MPVSIHSYNKAFPLFQILTYCLLLRFSPPRHLCSVFELKFGINGPYSGTAESFPGLIPIYVRKDLSRKEVNQRNNKKHLTGSYAGDKNTLYTMYYNGDFKIVNKIEGLCNAKTYTLQVRMWKDQNGLKH